MNTNQTHAVEWMDKSYNWPSQKVREIAVQSEQRFIELLTEINKNTSKIINEHSNGGNDSWIAVVKQTEGTGFSRQMINQVVEIAHLAQTIVDLAGTLTMKNSNEA